MNNNDIEVANIITDWDAFLKEETDKIILETLPTLDSAQKRGEFLDIMGQYKKELSWKNIQKKVNVQSDDLKEGTFGQNRLEVFIRQKKEFERKALQKKLPTADNWTDVERWLQEIDDQGADVNRRTLIYLKLLQQAVDAGTPLEFALNDETLKKEFWRMNRGIDENIKITIQEEIKDITQDIQKNIQLSREIFNCYLPSKEERNEVYIKYVRSVQETFLDNYAQDLTRIFGFNKTQKLRTSLATFNPKIIKYLSNSITSVLPSITVGIATAITHPGTQNTLPPRVKRIIDILPNNYQKARETVHDMKTERDKIADDYTESRYKKLTQKFDEMPNNMNLFLSQGNSTSAKRNNYSRPL